MSEHRPQEGEFHLPPESERAADPSQPGAEPQAHRHEHDGAEHEGVIDRLWHRLAYLGHSHEVGAVVDPALAGSERGIWTLKVSIAGLGLTALFQLVIALLSGSAALLADTVHNIGDAATSIPLWIAFSLSRRRPTPQYPYGYGRAEDLAGVIIVLVILASAVIAGYESVSKLLNPRPMTHIWWVGAAAIVGFLGNEAVAGYRIRVGRQIGSAALVADGQHARIDGLTSLAVLGGVIGTAAGFPILDPLIGLGITIVILFILKDAAGSVLRRLMDAVEPEIIARLEREAAGTPGVHDVHDLRVRWLGHTLHAELHIRVDEDLPTRESHRIAEEVRHRLLHAEPRLVAVFVHVDPCGHGGRDPHDITAHHQGTR